MVAAHTRRIGLVFQDGQLLPHYSVKSNLLYGYNNCAPDARRFNLDSIVELLELQPLLERRPNALSGGERQRVALWAGGIIFTGFITVRRTLSALDERLKQQILPFLPAFIANAPYL